MSADDVPSGATHLDLGTLAELDEGLLAPAAEARGRRHVERCAECTRRLASVTGVRAALASAPVEPLPATVGARLDAALARAARRPATPLHRPPRWQQWRPSGGLLAGTAAGSIVVLLFGALLFGAIRDKGGAGPASGSAMTAGGGQDAEGPSAQESGRVTASGRSYTAATLPAAVSRLLSARSATGAAPSAATDGYAAALQASRLRDPRALEPCLVELAGRPGVRPLAVDLGSYGGRPAAVVVLPEAGRPALLDVWVVAPGCTKGDPQLLYFIRLPRPTGMSAP